MTEGIVVIGEYGRVYFADRNIVPMLKQAIKVEHGELIYVLGVIDSTPAHITLRQLHIYHAFLHHLLAHHTIFLLPCSAKGTSCY